MLDFIIGLDWQIFSFINSTLTAEWANWLFPLITDLHKTPFFKLTVVPLVLGIFIWRRGIKKGPIIFLFLIFSLLAADGIGNHGFKKVFERPRPGDTVGLNVQVRSPYGGYSFVSNHAANMFAFASFTSAMFPAAAIPMYALATTIGYSRVYNGVHFPSDVFGGAMVGIFSGLTFAYLCRRVTRRFDTVEVLGS